MSAARVTYSLRHDATLESQHNALAAVYRFLIETRASKEGGTWSALDDAMKGSKHDRAK